MGSDLEGRARVLVVAAVKLYREGVAQALAREDRFDVAGTARTAHEAIVCVSTTNPDVSLVDLAMPGSLVLVRAMREARPSAQVVVLSVPETEHEVLACAEAGAAGFVTVDGSLDDLVATLESVCRGETLCSPRIAGALLRRLAILAGTPGTGLTAREHEILGLVERGLTNKEIGRTLQIELPTVKNHVHNILGKLQVTRRSEAAARFRGGISVSRGSATPVA